tara:strand:- start:2576 stop:3715 length:1140 start_codon:yes stop_codon:yes gene_type:complete
LKKKILITGANGFIGKNLLNSLYLKKNTYDIITLKYNSSKENLTKKVLNADFIIHLAGVNRPKMISQFESGNYGFTKKITDILIKSQKRTPVIYSSTMHIDTHDNNNNKLMNHYVKSKISAERCLTNYVKKNKSNLFIYRLPHVIGKWAKPNYNSVIATFCSNISRNKKIIITNPDKILKIIHIDQLINSIIKNIEKDNAKGINFIKIRHINISVLNLSEKLIKINFSLNNFLNINLKKNIDKILYSTFISYLPNNRYIKKLVSNTDSRGKFVECFKSETFGQISFLTSKPNVIRGNHFHNIKTEIFIVISGVAEYKSSNPITHSLYKKILKGDTPQLVRTIPGEIHTIKNIGKKELIVLVWANEIFDKHNPDTYYLND